jgi:hypothetical protein
MNTDRTFTNVDDQVLQDLISHAAQRVMFVAPGLRKGVADALAGALQKMPGKVTVVLDVDAEVCRLGYGDEKGLVTIKAATEKAGTRLHHQPGVRIGLLITDDTTIIYSPVPLLIEAGSQIPDKPNAIVLNGVVPAAIETACGLGVGAAGLRQVGLDFVNDSAVAEVQENLKANPAVPITISQTMLVFNSRVEFVEFNLEKIQLQRQEIPIPPEVMGLADSNIHSLFRLDVGKELLAEKEKLEHKKREIEKQFTRPMRGFGGSLIQRAQKDEFHTAVKGLAAALELFRVTVRQQFRAVAESNKAKLVGKLLPALKAHPPEECKQFAGRPNEDEWLRKWLLGELFDPFDKVAKVADEMRVTVRFKGVTYECLTSPDFIERAREAFPNLQLHEEFTAARETNVKEKQPKP